MTRPALALLILAVLLACSVPRSAEVIPAAPSSEAASGTLRPTGAPTARPVTAGTVPDGAPPSRAVRLVENPAGQSAAPRKRLAAARVASVTGTATYYCRPPTSRCTRGYPPDCLCAAAGPELRAMLGDWRGQRVVVTDRETGRSVVLLLADYCECPLGSGHVIDLYWSALQALKPGAEWGAPVVVRRGK